MLLSTFVGLYEVTILLIQGIYAKVEDTQPLDLQNYGYQNEITSNWNFVNDASSNSSEDSVILRYFCPTNYCEYNLSSSYDTAGDVLCCVPCDCSDQCFEVGNCCYDKDHTHRSQQEVDVELGVCTHTSVGNSVRFASTSYMLYQHCGITEDDDLVLQCIKPNGDTIDGLLPVYSQLTGRHYRNIYCARCNNDQDELIKWTQIVKCTFDSDFAFLFNNTSYYHQNGDFITKLKSGMIDCQLFLTSPHEAVNNTAPIECVHTDNIIDTCNSSIPSNLEWQDKCKSYYSPVYHGVHLYRNVFCLMCNDALESGPINCVNNVSDIFYTMLPVTALLSPESYTLLEYQTQPRYRCSPPNVYNEELNTCLKMRCPLTTFPAGDKCFEVITSLNNVYLDFRVNVIYPRFISFKLDTVLKEISNIFTNTFNKSTICTSELKDLVIHEDTVVLEVQIVLVVHEPMPLRETYSQFVSTIQRHNKQGNNPYTLGVKKKVILKQHVGSAYLLPFKDEIDTEYCKSMAMTDLLFCELVVLAVQVTHDDDSVDVVGGLIFQPGDYIGIVHRNGSLYEIYVCLDTYISRWKESMFQNVYNQGASGNDIHVYVMLSVLCLCSCYLMLL